MKEYKFLLFPFHSIWGNFKKKALEEKLNLLWKDGFRLRKRELSLEPARGFLFFQRLSFGILFEKDPKKPEPDTDVKIVSDNDGLFFRTINSEKLQTTLNHYSDMGYDLSFCFNYLSKHLFFFNRSHYLFIFTRQIDKKIVPKKIHIFEHKYRFWTQTINESDYESDINNFLKDKELKYSVRTLSYRYMGLLTITSSIIIAQTDS